MKFAFDQTALPGRDFGEQIRYAAEAGADGLGVCWLNPVEAARFNDRVGARETLRAVQRAGMEVSSLTLDCLSDRPSPLGSPAERAEANEVLARGLAFATHLGTSTVVLPFAGRSRVETDADLSQAIATISTGSALAARLGISLAIRCALNSNLLQFLLVSCEHPDRIRISLDIADAAAKGLDAGTIIRKLGSDQLAQIYVRDVIRSSGQPPDFRVRLGRGLVDFPAVRQALPAIGFDGWIVVDTPRGDSGGQIASLNMADARQLLRPLPSEESQEPHPSQDMASVR
ncbi:MAG: hypothetical protein BIFFINMI_00618 [Phycisphaerae bacterium]|nr:hypothetical protein [Phycisphaerae bacterium]